MAYFTSIEIMLYTLTESERKREREREKREREKEGERKREREKESEREIKHALVYVGLKSTWHVVKSLSGCSTLG
jgi:hypothetical protein